jgi:prevent-host-death family protein
MKTVDAGMAAAELQRLLDEAASGHEPVRIDGKGVSGVLLSEEDWRAVQETLHILAVPGMRESIREGLKTPVEECSEEPGW